MIIKPLNGSKRILQLILVVFQSLSYIKSMDVKYIRNKEKDILSC